MNIKKISKISLLLFITTITPLFALTHQELANKVYINNPSLINSKKDVDLAKLDLKDAKANYQPTVDFLTTATYMVNPPLGKIVVNPEDYITGETGTSGTLANLGLDGPITVYKGMEDTLYNFDIKITQPLYTWNKINTSVSLYDKVVSIKDIQAKTLFKKLSSELEAREAAVYYLIQMKNNLAEQKEIADELISIVNDAYENEILVEQDLLEAQIKAKKIDVGLQQIDKEEKTQLSQIIKLTNDRSIEIEDIEYQFDEKKIDNFLTQDDKVLLDRATSLSNDNIQILSILDDVKQDELSIAKNSIYYKPDFALQVEASYSGSRVPLIEKGYYTQDQSGLNFTLAIKTNLWDGGKKINDIARKKINEEEAQYNIDDAKNQIIQTFNENLYTMKLATSNIEYEELNSKIINSKINNLQQEFEQGYGDKASILQEQLEKKASELEILKQKTQRVQSYFTIMYLLN